MNGFSEALFAWFRKEGRSLPWRQTRDPYKIWLSEVILQQTRVQQGMAYYHRFLEQFPDVEKLAKASEEEVLSLWQGLGYYSRGRNLLVTAREITTAYGGDFPKSNKELLKLKGIGPYTAAAIASFAFHENVAAVDGNVIRVICRLFAIEEDVRLPSTVQKVSSLAASLLPAGHAWEFNQSMMEFGAMLCTPAKPSCGICPVGQLCEGRKKGLQGRIPFKSKAAPRKKRYFNYLLAESDGRFAFQCREQKDIWQGLFEPLLLEEDKPFLTPEDFKKIRADFFEYEIANRLLPLRKCILSHQEILVSVLVLRLQKQIELPGFRWVSALEMKALPKPVIFSKILPDAEASLLYLSL